MKEMEAVTGSNSSIRRRNVNKNGNKSVSEVKNAKIGKTKVDWTLEQTKKLAKGVEDNPCLWDLSDDLYKLPDAHISSWNEVSKFVGYSADECKKKWKSVKDALRYRKKGITEKRKNKSGDSAGEEDLDEYWSDDENNSTLISWELYENVKFLNCSKPSRKTYSSGAGDLQSQKCIDTNKISLSTSNDEIITDATENTANFSSEMESTGPGQEIRVQKRNNEGESIYEYANKRKKPDKCDVLLTGINQLIASRTKKMDDETKKGESQLKYMSIYTNLDRMLQKLPDSVVEDLNMQFIEITYKEIKKCEI